MSNPVVPPETVALTGPNGRMAPEWYRYLQGNDRRGYQQAVANDNLVSQVDTLSTTVGENTADLTIVKQSVAGLEARYSVTVNVNGYVTGIELLGTGSAGSFTIMADQFRIIQPNQAGGDVVKTPFSIGLVNGLGRLSLSGDMIVDGSITTRTINAGAVTAEKISVSALSAITADIGTVTAGLIRNAGDTIRFDLPAMRIYRTDGLADLDFANLRFRMGV